MPKEAKDVSFAIHCKEEDGRVKCEVSLAENGKKADCTVTGTDSSMVISCTGNKELMKNVENVNIERV